MTETTVPVTTQTTTTTSYAGGASKSKLAAYLLWFFFGGLAAHRFYAGKIGSAIAMLVLCVGGWIATATLVGAVLGVPMLIAFGIWWLLDAFLISTWGLASAQITVEKHTVTHTTGP